MPFLGKKIVSLQVARALAAIAVVFYHLHDIVNDSKVAFLKGVSFPPFFDFLEYGSLGVELFFVLSGFIILYVSYQDIGKPESVPRYYLKRFFRIWPLLAVLTTIKIAYLVAAGTDSVADNKALSTEVYLASYFMIPVMASTGPVIAPAWTLNHEMFFYSFFCLALLFGPRVLFGACVVWFIGMLLQAFLQVQNNVSILFVFHSHNVQFLFGMGLFYVLKKTQEKAKPVSGWGVLGLGLAMLAGTVALRMNELLPLGGDAPWWNGFVEAIWPGSAGPSAQQILGVWIFVEAIWWGLVFSMILWGLMIAEKGKVKFPKVLELLGDASYSIYLIHTSIIMASFALAPKLIKLLPQGAQESLNSLLFTGPWQLGLWGIALASVVGGLVCYFIIERPLYKGSQKLIYKMQPKQK